MTPGHDLCGRFRLRQVQQTRADRVVWTANDLVTKRMVCVHVGGTSLMSEVPMLQQIQGRGVVPFVGLWRDGAQVALVFGYRLPQTAISGSHSIDCDRCAHWLSDLAAALSRLQVAGLALGSIDGSRMWVSGDSAWLDATGPHVEPASMRSDLTAVVQRVAAVADPTVGKRGPRRLVKMLANPDPDCRPATALSLRRLTERALTSPKRSVGPARHVEFAPRHSHQLVVEGPDAVWIRVGSPVSGWRRSIRRWKLRRSPANRRWQRVALGWRDVVFTAAIGAVAAVVLPCIGGPIALFVAWQWRRARCRPGTGDSLERLEWGSDEAVVSLALAVEGELPPRSDTPTSNDRAVGA